LPTNDKNGALPRKRFSRSAELQKKAAKPRSVCVKKVMRTILLLILIVLLIGALPTWPYSTGWGYYPSGGFGLILLILIILALMRKV
jgi:hypothetical protein